MTARDVLSPCPGWEGKGVSATLKVLCMVGAGPSVLSGTRGGSPQPYPHQKVHLQLSYPIPVSRSDPAVHASSSLSATWASCLQRGQERRRAHPGRARCRADAIFTLMVFPIMSFGRNLSFLTKKVVKIPLYIRSSVQP